MNILPKWQISSEPGWLHHYGVDRRKPNWIVGNRILWTSWRTGANSQHHFFLSHHNDSLFPQPGHCEGFAWAFRWQVRPVLSFKEASGTSKHPQGFCQNPKGLIVYVKVSNQFYIRKIVSQPWLVQKSTSLAELLFTLNTRCFDFLGTTGIPCWLIHQSSFDF